MTAFRRSPAARAFALLFVLVAGTALGVAVTWLWLAVRAGDARGFWVLYLIAMCAIGVAVLNGRRALLTARAELARRTEEYRTAHHPHR